MGRKMWRQAGPIQRLLLLGCLQLACAGTARAMEQPGSLPGQLHVSGGLPGWGHDDGAGGRGGHLQQQQQQAGGRRLLFDVNELHQQETLRAAEEHQLAVLDGRSKPLFSDRTMFSPEPVTKLFAGGAGLDDSSQQRQQQRGGGGGGSRAGGLTGQQATQRLLVAGGEGHFRTDSGGQQQQQGGTKQASAFKGGSGQQQQQQQQGEQQAGQGVAPARQQRPSGKPPGGEAAAYPLMLDAAAVQEEVPDPELQYKDEGSTRILIWLPQDTMPRDLLLGQRPQVWLYCLVEADYGAAALLPHYVDHYLRLGIRPERMLFVVNHNPALGLGADALGNATSVLDSLGLDYRVWVGRYSEEAHLRHKLQVLARVPVRDWVVAAAADELHEYGGLSAPAFLAKCDAEGFSWVRGAVVDRVAAGGELGLVHPAPALAKQFPLKCDLGRKVAGAEGSRVAAFKAYLRPKATADAVLPAGPARKYFGPAPAHDPHSPRLSLCAADDLLPLTPYARYWKFYKAPDIQGNPYLWDAREAVDRIKIHHFKWRVGLERSVGDRLRHWKEEDQACGGTGEPRFAAWQEAQRVADTILAKGLIDVQNTYLQCQLAEDMKLPTRRRQQRAGPVGQQQQQQQQQQGAAAAGATAA